MVVFMETAYLILLVLNAMALPVLVGLGFIAWEAKRQLAKSQKLFDDVAKAAAEATRNHAQAMQQLGDKVAALQVQNVRGMTVASR